MAKLKFTDGHDVVGNQIEYIQVDSDVTKKSFFQRFVQTYGSYEVDAGRIAGLKAEFHLTSPYKVIQVYHDRTLEQALAETEHAVPAEAANAPEIGDEMEGVSAE